jgi:hypothetical protein
LPTFFRRNFIGLPRSDPNFTLLTRARLNLVTLQSLQPHTGNFQEYGLLVLLIERLAADEPRLVSVQADQA